MRTFVVYSMIVAASALLPINPFVILLMTGMRSYAAYSLFVDLWLVAIIFFGWLYVSSERTVFGRTVCVLVALTLPALFVGELAYVYVRYVYADQFLGGVADIYQNDPKRVYALRPEASDRHVSVGNFEARYVIDDKGRKKIDQNGKRSRSVHVFGDSFTFGYGVSNEDTWLNIVQDQIGKEYHFYNYGVAGYGIEQMYWQIRTNLQEIDAGDIVILAPVSDDLERSLIGKTFVCGSLIRDRSQGAFPVMKDDEWTWVQREEKCNYFLDTLLANSSFPISFGSLYRKWQRAAHHDALLDNAERIFAEAERLVQRHGATFHLLFLATPGECAKGALDFDLSDLEAPYRSLLPYCPDQPGDADDLRFPFDGHWNKRGNQWAADAFLQEFDQFSSMTKAGGAERPRCGIGPVHG